jgi:hypothetical protein
MWNNLVQTLVEQIKRGKAGGEEVNNNKREARQACVAMEESDVGGRDFRQLWSLNAACPLLIKEVDIEENSNRI